MIAQHGGPPSPLRGTSPCEGEGLVRLTEAPPHAKGEVSRSDRGIERPGDSRMGWTGIVFDKAQRPE